MWKTMDEKTLKSRKVAELREIARTFGLEGYEKMKKADLVAALMTDGSDIREEASEPVADVSGVSGTFEEKAEEISFSHDDAGNEPDREADENHKDYSGEEHTSQNSHGDRH